MQWEVIITLAASSAAHAISGLTRLHSLLERTLKSTASKIITSNFIAIILLVIGIIH